MSVFMQSENHVTIFAGLSRVSFSLLKWCWISYLGLCKPLPGPELGLSIASFVRSVLCGLSFPSAFKELCPDQVKLGEMNALCAPKGGYSAFSVTGRYILNVNEEKICTMNAWKRGMSIHLHFNPSSSGSAAILVYLFSIISKLDYLLEGVHNWTGRRSTKRTSLGVRV